MIGAGITAELGLRLADLEREIAAEPEPVNGNAG